MSADAVARAVVGTGWIVHLAQWLAATIARRGRVAHRGEWTRELAIRAGMIVLVVMALRSADGSSSDARRAAGLAVFAAGTAIAMLGRRALGDAWGIGVRPHAPASAARIYGALRHPIYVGTSLAAAGQWLALGDRWSLALLAAAVVIAPIKAARERAWLRRQSAATAERRAS